MSWFKPGKTGCAFQVFTPNRFLTERFEDYEYF